MSVNDWAESVNGALARGMSQADLARASGFSEATVSRALAGKSSPRNRTRQALQDAARAWVEARNAGDADTPPRLHADPVAYLEALSEEHEHLEIRGMGAPLAQRMPLDAVYTSLRVTPARLRRGPASAATDPDDRPDFLDIEDLLVDHPHVVLLGDPGSGKTTFLRYVAGALARAHLGRPSPLDASWARDTDPPFPVFVRITDVARYLASDPEPSFPDDSPALFYRFLESHIRSRPSLGLDPMYLEHRVLDGGCVLLLDGLDEVPSRRMRQRLARIVEGVVVDGRVRNRHVLTCRTRAYEGRTQLLGRVELFRLANLDRRQIERFVRGWSGALHGVDPEASGGSAWAGARAHEESLLVAIDQHPLGAGLSANPLMLTMLAVVHWNGRRLPEQRAELYGAAVDYLLESRDHLPGYPIPLRRECLAAVALRTYLDAEGLGGSPDRQEAAEGTGPSLDRDLAAAVVAPILGVDRVEALRFVEEEELHSGILVSRAEGEVGFWHRTLQEYLAALELSQDDGGWGRLEAHVLDSDWSEVTLLYAGVRRRGGLRRARRLIQDVLEPASGSKAGVVELAAAVALCGRILADIRPYGGDPTQGTSYERALREVLPIFAADPPAVEERIRVDVGEALGRGGDPRLRAPAGNQVRIMGGSFERGAQGESPGRPGFDEASSSDEGPVEADAVGSFFMSRFPVTVFEYRRFLEGRGPGQDPSTDSLTAHRGSPRSGDGIAIPLGWDAQLGHPNRPVTGVSWHEAVVYCRAAGGRLPTEVEWEFAARGRGSRRFPWGDELPTAGHANFDGRLGHPAPVGVYPIGASSEGVRDLAGNVYEWCAETVPRRAGYFPSGGGIPSPPALRPLRGGSFRVPWSLLRAAHRILAPPSARGPGIGFRVVWDAAPEEEDAPAELVVRDGDRGHG